jgi:hypothetical protein
MGVAWRKLLWLNGALLLAAVAGQALRPLFVPVDKLLIYTGGENEAALDTALANFRQWAQEVIAQDVGFAFVWLLSVVALAGAVMVGGMRSMHSSRVFNLYPALVATTILLAGVISVVATLLSGNFQDHFSARYLLPTLYLPLFLGFPLLTLALASRSEPRRVLWWAGVGASLALVALLLVVTRVDLRAQLVAATQSNYHDPFLRCLVQESAARNLRYGLADYWQAEVITGRTGGALTVVPIGSDLTPIFWNNHPARYSLPFEFIILQHDALPDWQLSPNYVLQRFGVPADTFACGSSDIWVYNRAADLPIRQWFANRPEFAELEQIGDRATFFGFALSTENGARVVGLSQGASEAWGNPDGTMAYAHLSSLPPGVYALALDLYADSANTGAWEVIGKHEEEAVTLTTHPIVEAGKLRATGHFTLTQPSDVEIRVKYHGNGTLFVDSLHLAHVDGGASRDDATLPSTESTTIDGAAPTGEVVLLYPPADFELGERELDFAWHWRGEPLAPGQGFEVRVWQSGDSVHYGAHDAVAGRALLRQIGDSYILRLDMNGAHSVGQGGAGDYWWSVGVVAIDPAYQDLGSEAPPRSLRVLPSAGVEP